MPEELLEFVMDIERYTEVDDKIGPIDWARRQNNVTEFKFRSTLPGIPGPTPKVVSRMQLTPGERVDITYAPLPQNKLNHRISTFNASLVCEPVDGGTRVTRTLSIEFMPFLRWLLEPILRRTLPADVEHEIWQAKEYLERHSAQG